MAETTEQSDVISETRRPYEDSAARRLLRNFLLASWALWTTIRLSVFLSILLLLCLLFLDLPMRLYDALSGPSAMLFASNWLSQGEAWLPVSVLFLLLVTRRRGGVVAARVTTLAWVFAAAFVAILLIYMAPQLVPGDYPQMRFMGGLVGSWYAGQLVAINIYDLTRGGKWWRAPLYGALFGFAVQTAIYFPVVFAGSGSPWINWMVMDFCLKAGIAVLFLAVYYPLRRPIRAYIGEGGY